MAPFPGVPSTGMFTETVVGPSLRSIFGVAGILKIARDVCVRDGTVLCPFCAANRA